MDRAQAEALAGGRLPPALYTGWELLSAELLRWSAVHRLTGHADPEAIYLDLLLDSLSLLPLVEGSTLLDIGSGAGFPGLVLALARPELQVTLLEGRAKKVSFQKQAVRLLGLAGRVRAVQGRAGVDLLSERFDTVTLRAVAGLAESLALARPYLALGGVVLLPRGLRDQDQARALGLAVREYRLPGIKESRIIASYQEWLRRGRRFT
ncbi:MAG: 16S rRNA (guanine(527)-N(7))-methyltransferase RsmG [Thermodesulfobacteriota bacterium]